MGRPLRAAEPPPSKASPYVAPLPAVVAFAAAKQIPLERVEISPDGAAAGLGDSVSALVTLFEGEHYRQWLIHLGTLDLTAEERAAKPPHPMIIHLSTGSRFAFAGTRMALELQLAGPFRDDASTHPAEKRVRALVNREFLGLGLDRASATLQRLSTATGKDQAGFDFSSKPFSPETVAQGRARADALGLTVDDERSLAGLSPALLAFFDVAQKTPGLRDILSAILDKSSLAWSALTHGGKLEPSFHVDWSGVSPIETEKWGPHLPPSYRLPFLVSINEKPTLACQLVVTAPRPPLLASAGILGFIVEQPADQSKVLVMRVLSARRAESPPTP